MASYGQHAARIGLDHINQTQFPASDSFLFFQRGLGPYCAKKTQIRSGWPGQVLAKDIWSRSKLVCKNHWAWFLAECNQKLQVYKFPHFQTWLPSYTDGLDYIVHNQARSDLVLADCIRFWLKQVWSGCKPVRKNHPARFWPVLPSWSGSDANRIWHVYWVESLCCSNRVMTGTARNKT